MGYVCKTKLEKAWIIASVLILAAHRLLQSAAPDFYADATPLRLWLEVVIFVSSFPLGVTAVYVVHDATYWCDGCGAVAWMLDWSTLLFGGYIQWFWVLPEFFRGRQLTLLDLKRTPETVAPDTHSHIAAETHAPSATATPAPLAATTRVPLAAATLDPLAVAPPASSTEPPASLIATPHDVRAAAPPHVFDTAACCAPAFAEFDEAGLSALDRVFQAHAAPTAATPASQVEAIFPRVS
ncbi:MAG: hypothetical protein QOD32_170 [Pyrinomonadaceae bacterium]|jgi:hypothetical protein|nr:hypothetical protein [Pyrinomonadaceae bacterium]